MSDDIPIMRQWFLQNAPQYLERTNVPEQLRENRQQMSSFLYSVLDSMIDGYSESLEKASSSALLTPKSQTSSNKQSILGTPSNSTNLTPTTLPSFGMGDIASDPYALSSLPPHVNLNGTSAPKQAFQDAEDSTEGVQIPRNVSALSNVEWTEQLPGVLDGHDLDNQFMTWSEELSLGQNFGVIRDPLSGLTGFDANGI
jgi:hypothetical protein